MGRIFGTRPLSGMARVSAGPYTAGSDTSLPGWNPSEVLALQRTLMKFLKSRGLASEISGA